MQLANGYKIANCYDDSMNLELDIHVLSLHRMFPPLFLYYTLSLCITSLLAKEEPNYNNKYTEHKKAT